MSEPRRILVVEDEGITALDLERTLRRMGYEVPCSVASGPEAIAAVATHRVDLLLCDIVLRGEMDGIEAATQIRHGFKIPVVFLTAFGDTTTLRRARSADPYGYLIKPFHDEELRSTIETALSRFDLEQRLAQSEVRQRQLAASLQSALERERTQLARDLHDELGQVLTHLRLELAWLQGHPVADAEKIAKLSGELLGVVDGALRSVRRIATDLRPPILDEGDISSAMDWQCRLFAQRSRCEVHLDLQLSPLGTRGIGKDGATALFRILQEALTNVARHAQASAVYVDLADAGEAALLRIRDDGVGLGREGETRGQIAAGGLGILGMRERASSLGGSLDVRTPSGGRGVEIEVRMPWQPEALREGEP